MHLPQPETRRASLALAALALALCSSPARGQMPWLEAEDGDWVHVHRAEAPPRGQYETRMWSGGRRLEEGGTLAETRFVGQYGLAPFLSLGVSVPYLQQRNGALHKEGLGDTNLSLKLHIEPYEDIPLRVGIRQSLSLPTGYEEERKDLRAFTSRQYDYAARGLVQYNAFIGRRGLIVALNPGLLLPGGEVHSYATGGLGLELQEVLPFGLHGYGEYYTRWDLVTHDFEAELAFGVSRSLFLGFGFDVGARRTLLQETAAQPEMHVGLSFGWPHRGDPEIVEVETPLRDRAPLLVLPIECRVPDPHGVAALLGAEIRNRATGDSPPKTVFVRTVPGEHLETLHAVRHYELALRILDIKDGTVAGHTIPMLLRAARGRTEITAQLELISPDGYTVASRAVLRGVATRAIKTELVPTSSSVAALVTPDETKDVLRRAAVKDLARQLIQTAIAAIDARDRP